MSRKLEAPTIQDVGADRAQNLDLQGGHLVSMLRDFRLATCAARLPGTALKTLCISMGKHSPFRFEIRPFLCSVDQQMLPSIF